MKMRHEEVSHILLSPQCAHDLGDGQCGKNTLGLHTQRHERGEHCDQQSGVQTVALEVHEADLENRFHDLPETRNDMMLLPNVPDFRSPERSLTKIARAKSDIKRNQCRTRPVERYAS